MAKKSKNELLQGTLDMLVMKALADEPLHGYALGHRLQLITGGRLQVPQGSLYPALHRLELRGYLKSEWVETDTGRAAKVYRLTVKGQRQLEAEVLQWHELASTIAMVLGTT